MVTTTRTSHDSLKMLKIDSLLLSLEDDDDDVDSLADDSALTELHNLQQRAELLQRENNELLDLKEKLVVLQQENAELKE